MSDRFDTFDNECMVQAIRLAVRGVMSTHPNPRVGCVLAKDGAQVAEGWHEKAGGPHAEIVALEEARDAARGATAYVTLEPCAHQGRTGPCTKALLDAGVARVVIAMQDPNPKVAGKGIDALRGAGVEVEVGLMEAEARKLNPGFIKRMTEGRPLTRLKIAASLDGRTAMASGESKWITGEVARADVQHWRSAASGILTGVETVLADNPRLNVRLDDVPRQPERLILDSTLRTPVDAEVLALDTKVRIFAVEDDAQKRSALEAAGAEVEILKADANGRVDLPTLMSRLAELEHNELWVEAGATLGGALLTADLVDEVVLYQAPVFLGDAAKPLAVLPGLDALADRLRFAVDDVSQVGGDLRMMMRPASRVMQEKE
ncbi:MAG: bifunctional diaminohydroxyphosphoribosylaminopyrimidine deaminase/5-amino-6-(5-phosphoribosylamino)uracil reductase RibD [Gammaproteobacteria bacterium]|nr:bifunctional diaminohydroxyphosphoribosylaminopyrimidine deaminase/5-amino-6-(5-phosphoribosylamino)uracil reductase RibD [Gammaproteobacteria bacterium]